MRTNAEVIALRELARSRQRAANKKVSRLNRVGNVEIGGTKYDPRKPLKLVDRYTERQLKSYIAKLDSFIDRKTQYKPDSKFRPIPIEKWRAYKKVERAYNVKAKKELDKVEAIKLPNGMTIGQRRAMTEAPHPQMLNPAVNSRKPINRKSISVSSGDKLGKLMKDLNKRFTPKQMAAEVKKNRRVVDDMLSYMGLDDIRERIADLDSKQFSLLFNHSSDFMNTLAWIYDNQKIINDPNSSKNAKQIARDQNKTLMSGDQEGSGGLEELVSWAEKL